MNGLEQFGTIIGITLIGLYVIINLCSLNQLSYIRIAYNFIKNGELPYTFHTTYTDEVRNMMNFDNGLKLCYYPTHQILNISYKKEYIYYKFTKYFFPLHYHYIKKIRYVFKLTNEYKMNMQILPANVERVYKFNGEEITSELRSTYRNTRPFKFLH